MADIAAVPDCRWRAAESGTDSKEKLIAPPARTTSNGSEVRDLKLEKACAAMEAQFIDYLFKEMRETIPETGFIPRGSAEKMYTSLLDSQMAEKISQEGGIGLAPILYRQLSGLEDQSGEPEKK